MINNIFSLFALSNPGKKFINFIIGIILLEICIEFLQIMDFIMKVVDVNI